MVLDNAEGCAPDEEGGWSKYKSDLPVVIYRGIKAKLYHYYEDTNRNDLALALGFYVWAYDTVRHQGNIRIHATNDFIRKGTGISKAKIPVLKSDLEKMGLIKSIVARDSNNQIIGHYLEVQFAWKPEALDKLFYQERNETTEYKIAKALLIENFGVNYTFKVDDYYEFQVVIDDREFDVLTGDFWFDDDGLLVCDGDGVYDLGHIIVPTYLVEEIVKDIASNYQFSAEAVYRVMTESING